MTCEKCKAKEIIIGNLENKIWNLRLRNGDLNKKIDDMGIINLYEEMQGEFKS